MEDIRRVNDAGSDAKNTSFVLASWRTKRRLILRFDLTGGSAELTNTDRADEADALVEKSGPALVRTGAGTSCLASMFKSTRISFIFSIADRTYTFYFHLWLPPKFTNIIAQLGRTRKGFMGKEWDGQVPSVEVWKECLRVLKPGAFAFILCAPRQDSVSEMIQNLKEAGFVISFSSLFHCFATGFPKSGNLSKLADKRAGKEREVVDVDKSAQRPNAVQAHQEGQSGNFGLKGGGSGLITAPATLEAKALDGSYAGYQPKPAVEIVIVVMRPLAEKTYLDQALANGHGCTQLDAGRIPYEGKQPTGSGNRERGGWRPSGPNEINNAGWTGNDGNVTPPHGRFAPNLLCSDDALNDGSDHKSGAMQYKVHPTSGFGGSENDYGNNSITPVTGNHASSGSYSRYFSLDAWSAKNLPESVNRTFPFLIVPKASKSEKNAGLEGLPDKDMWNGHANQINGSGKPAKQITSKNSHATVKPIKLMSYLIAIGSRPGDVVLDPYAGTCTTGIAAALLDRRYICIEQDADGDGWCDIGRRRIAWHVEQAQAEVSEKYDPEELREARRQYYERHKGEELDVYEVVEGSGTVMGQLDMFD